MAAEPGDDQQGEYDQDPEEHCPLQDPGSNEEGRELVAATARAV